LHRQTTTTFEFANASVNAGGIAEMSSAQTKASLKAARDAISKKDYAKALDKSRSVLAFEPANYNAHVFAGVSLLNLGQLENSENSYREAISISPSNALAWQGLLNLFERKEDLNGLKEASLALADIYAQTYVVLHQWRLMQNSNEEQKCLGAIDKFVSFVKSKGTPAQVVDLFPSR
jgi:superkiller protein 3